MTIRRAARWRPLAAVLVLAVCAAAAAARAQESESEAAAAADPTGLAVDGVIRSNKGGFAFPDGHVMRRLPRLEKSGPVTCAPEAGETRSCPVPGEWDLCAVSGIAMARFNAFVEPACSVVEHGDGAWSIDIVSSGQFIIRCQAACIRLDLN